MSRIHVIVNPLAGRGHAERLAPQIEQELQSLGTDFAMTRTRFAGEAIDLAHEAVATGAEIVVAVGGDGTSHEVVNGLMAARDDGHDPILGCVPAGSGNDFSLLNGGTADVARACRDIVQGASKRIDVGFVTIDGTITRYFDNVVGLGFDALVTLGTREIKFLRGMALYVPVVLKTTFVTLHPPRVRIEYDGRVIYQRTMMTSICNGRREGGGFMVAPQAEIDDGCMDLIITDDVPRLKILAMVPHFMRGTHLDKDCVTATRAREVRITSDDPLYIHVDGEIISDVAHELEVRTVPQGLRIITPRNGHGPSSEGQG